MLRSDSSSTVFHPGICSKIPKRVDIATQVAFRDWLKLRTDQRTSGQKGAGSRVGQAIRVVLGLMVISPAGSPGQQSTAVAVQTQPRHVLRIFRTTTLPQPFADGVFASVQELLKNQNIENE